MIFSIRRSILGPKNCHCSRIVTLTSVTVIDRASIPSFLPEAKDVSGPSSSCTACGHKMAHRKWKETKQQPSMLPGPAVPGCCLISFHFLWAIHPICPVQCFSSTLLQGFEDEDLGRSPGWWAATVVAAYYPSKRGISSNHHLQNLATEWMNSAVQTGWSGCYTGNGEKLSNCQVCCLAQLSLAAA